MRENIKLFIGDREVEFSTPPQILYNYHVTDLINPTILKNSFSKSITIEGTPNNNKIFGQYWNVERIDSPDSFQAGSKAPFTLIFNGETIESGYMKLDNVRKTGNKVEYEVTLYGGLGEFFYQMSFNEAGEKLKMSDLQYVNGDTLETIGNQHDGRGEIHINASHDNEFDFKINKENLCYAWHIGVNDPDEGVGPDGSSSYLWYYVNFIPSYNGLPEDFDADKALINFNLSHLASTSGDYSGKNGYAMATLPNKMDEWEVRDLRSYLQRPALRVAATIAAIQRYAAKRGFDLQLDEDFFDVNNPYYFDTWLTLPMFSELETEGKYEGEGSIDFTGNYTTGGSIYKKEDPWTFKYDIDIDALSENTGAIFSTIQLFLDIQDADKPQTLEIAYHVPRTTIRNIFGGIAVQLVCYNGTDVVNGSQIYFLTNNLHVKAPVYSDYNFSGFYQNDVNTIYGEFEKQSNDSYKFFSENNPNLDFIITDNGIKYDSIKLVIQKVAEGAFGYISADPVRYFQDNANRALYGRNAVIPYFYVNSFSPVVVSSETDDSENRVRTGAKMTKKTLLSMDYTPADFLLNYCKQFGLYFTKSTYDNVIKIQTRANFYKRNEVVDLTQYIDRSKEISITPTTFDKKWYDFQLDMVEGQAAKDYQAAFDIKYGLQRVNTGYNFTTESKDVFEKNEFRAAVEVLESSKYMLGEVFDNGNRYPTYVNQGFKYVLYHGEDTKEIEIPKQIITNPIAINKFAGYDGFSKPQFCDKDKKSVDGSGVFVFFRKYELTGVREGTEIPTARYYISDYNFRTNTLNENDCWLYTEDEYDRDGNRIAIFTESLPSFGRYIYNGAGNIRYSLDFGEPKQLYIPEIGNTNISGIYHHYWRNYMRDLYNKDSKILSCYIRLDTKPNPTWLERFYWFDNCIWRINKIDDWNIAGYEPTRVEFLKVLDRENYNLIPVDGTNEVTLTCEAYAPYEGGLFYLYVNNEGGENWYADDSLMYQYQASPATGNTSAVITITLPANTGETEVERTFTLILDDDSRVRATTIQRADTFSVVRSNPEGIIPAEGGTEMIQVQSSENWTAITPANYVTLTPSTGATGTTMIGALFAENTAYTARTAVVSVSTASGLKNVSIQQAAALDPQNTIHFEAEDNTFAPEGGTLGFTLIADSPWTAETSESWLTFYSGCEDADCSDDRGGVGTYYGYLECEEHPYDEEGDRYASVTITPEYGYPVTIDFEQSDYHWNLIPNKYYFEAAQGGQTIVGTYTTNVPYPENLEMFGESWAHCRLDTEHNRFEVEVEPNYSWGSRDTDVIFEYEGRELTNININQEGTN